MSKRHYFYSERWQVLEERLNNETAAERQFVWGERALDDLVLRERSVGEDVSSSSSSEAHVDARLYATTDQWNVTACFNEAGRVAKRYAYEGFGASLVLSPEFTSRSTTGSLYDWETRFGGYRFDSETQLYQVRYRYLQPGLGRWISRDPDMNVVTRHSFVYCGNNAPNRVDTDGLRSKAKHTPPKPAPQPKTTPKSQPPPADTPKDETKCECCQRKHRLPGHLNRAGDLVPDPNWHSEWQNVIEDALDTYCKETNPNLTPPDFFCQIYAESNGNPQSRTGRNRGLFQISKNIWDTYNCSDELGDYISNVYDPTKNIQCAIKAMCRDAPTSDRGFRGRQTRQQGGWGTEGGEGSPFDCCIACWKPMWSSFHENLLA